MKWAFVLLSVVSVLSGLLSIIIGLENIALLVSGIFAILSGYAWYLVNEMSEEIESVRIRLLTVEKERETEER